MEEKLKAFLGTNRDRLVYWLRHYVPRADPVDFLLYPAGYLVQMQHWLERADLENPANVELLGSFLGTLMVMHGRGEWKMSQDGKEVYVAMELPFYPFDAASVLASTEEPDIAQWMHTMKPG